MIKSLKLLFSVCLTLLCLGTAQAAVYAWPKTNCDIVGQLQLAHIGLFDNITELDLKYDVGFDSMLAANPGYHLDHLGSGESLLIPTRFILPNAPRKGVVINVAEMRLYYFDNANHLVLSYPIGIGKVGEETPLGTTRIVKKTVDPIWTPTNEVKKNFLATNGFPLPEKFAPGPENPLGQYAMRLSFHNILIHGTNDPAGVGKRVSAGCIRMQNKNIGQLFEFVWVGLPVTVVNQPYKVAWQGDELFLEAHPPLSQKSGQFVGGYKALVKQALKQAPPGKLHINWRRIKQVAHLQMGVPERVAWVGDKKVQ